MIKKNNLQLQKKRPTLPYCQVKSFQKRHVIMGPSGMTFVGAIGVGLSFGPLSVLAIGFLVAFSFMADGGGGAGNGDIVNPTDRMLPMLLEMLHEVDTHRRNLMHQFREGSNIAHTMHQLLESNYNQFIAAHPDLRDSY